MVTLEQVVAVALQKLHAFDGFLGSFLLEVGFHGLSWKKRNICDFQ